MRAEGDATAPGPVADTTAAAGGVTASAVGNSGVNKDDAPAIVVNGLNFSYPGLDGKPIPGVPPVVKNMNLR